MMGLLTEKKKEKTEKKKREKKRKVMKKIGTKHPKGPEHPYMPECQKGLECLKPKNDKKKKESVEGKGVLIMSRKVVKRVLLVKREPLISYQLTCFQDMLGDFERYSTRTTFHQGVEHQIDFTLGAILPNKAVYRVNLEESKEIQ
ncbi:hypothetical protein CR513_07413, partial [Mucuna pruriens]